MNSYKHSVYLAASWRAEHNDMNNFVAGKLVNQHGLLVAGDHKAYGREKHERGLDYGQRVSEILETCSGVVVVFPKRNSPQTTAPYISLELLIACKQGLPALLFCEEGVEYALRRDQDTVTVTFGRLRQQYR